MSQWFIQAVNPKLLNTAKIFMYSLLNFKSMRGFQKQLTTIILDCLDGLDSETFHNDIFFKTVTAAAPEIPLYYIENYRKCL